MKRVSIVVPVYHNATSLAELLARFQDVARRNPEEFEFVFVDDGSADNSFQVLERLTASDPRVRALRLARNFGANAASSAGFHYATGDCIVAISADLQDPPELLDRMLAAWREGRRIVLAARTARHDPWLTSLTSRIFWRLYRRYAVPTMPAHGCDFVLVDRQVIQSLGSTREPTAGVGMLLWTGFEPAIVHYERQRRHPRHGQSMWSASKRLAYFIDSFVTFSNFPVRAASLLGITLAVLGVAYAALVVLSKLILGVNLQQGWASLVVVILVVSGAQLLMTGILGEYLLRALEIARQRPPFVVDRMVGWPEVPPRTPSLSPGAIPADTLRAFDPAPATPSTAPTPEIPAVSKSQR